MTTIKIEDVSQLSLVRKPLHYVSCKLLEPRDLTVDHSEVMLCNITHCLAQHSQFWDGLI